MKLTRIMVVITILLGIAPSLTMAQASKSEEMKTSKKKGLTITGITGENLTEEPDVQLITQLMNDIISDLKTDKIITSSKGLSYHLSGKKFIINGIKQSQQVFDKYRNKFLKNKDWAINYNFKVFN